MGAMPNAGVHTDAETRVRSAPGQVLPNMDWERRGRRQAWQGGTVAGLIGGVVLSVYMMAMQIAKGDDIWAVAKMAGVPFLGEAALRPGFEAGPVFVGILSHFAVSVAWGVLFGVLFYGFTRAATLVLGTVWGAIVWLGMFHVILPLAGAGEMAASTPVGVAVFEHVLFGLGVAVGFLPFQQQRR